jgi:hypothetical protein
MKVELTERYKTSAYKIQTLGIHPKERMQHSEHGDILKLRIRSHLLPSNCIINIYEV